MDEIFGAEKDKPYKFIVEMVKEKFYISRYEGIPIFGRIFAKLREQRIRRRTPKMNFGGGDIMLDEAALPNLAKAFGIELPKSEK